MQPLVSIVIPTYNRPRYVCDAVRSCLAQTYQDFEIIIADNSEEPTAVFEGGTLSFPDDANYYGHFKDRRIQYFSNGGNIGCTASTNRGMALATGKYVKMLMDDDLLKPRSLEVSVAALESHPDCAVAAAPMDIVDEHGERIEPYFYLFRKTRYRYRYQVGSGVLSRKRMLRDFLTRDYPCCVVSGVLFRASALREQVPFSDDYGFASDLKIMLTLAAKHDFFYVDEVLSSWRFSHGCHTARLHREGADTNLYYKVTNEALNNTEVRRMFGGDLASLVMDALDFCDARAALNFIPAANRMDWLLLLATLRVVHRNEQTGWLRRLRKLPLRLMREAVSPLFQGAVPPPRGDE